jgi:alkylation response protein AidB-like acyl-CoA dehydrogenase
MRLGVSMQAVGASRRAAELAHQYAEDRVQFNKPIKSFPGVSRKLEAMDKTLNRMRAYGFQGAYALDRYYKGYIPADVGATGDASEKMAANNFPSPVLTGLAHYYISQAKLYNTEISNYLLYDAQQIFGGSGFVSETEVNKIARDVRVLPIYEGTSEIHEWIISRAQDAINLLPKFKRVSDEFDEQTVYEKILFAKFPGVDGKI